MRRRKYKQRLNKALFVLYQLVNELDFIIKASPESAHIETIARLEWLKARVGESITVVTLNEEVKESLLEDYPWPR